MNICTNTTKEKLIELTVLKYIIIYCDIDSVVKKERIPHDDSSRGLSTRGVLDGRDHQS